MNERRVKVCGITRPEDALLAAELGAWALGFVMAPSPRRVTPAQAKNLVAAVRASATPGPICRLPLTVGVFVDTPATAIAEIVCLTRVDAVQLHSQQPGATAVRRALVSVLGEAAADVTIIQAVPVPTEDVDAGELLEAVASVRGPFDLLLFDTRSSGQFGGTGVPFPWEVARHAAAGQPFLVAGGLGPDNVGQALEATGAFAADVSSGVEGSPGLKDHHALRALFAALQEPSEGNHS